MATPSPAGGGSSPNPQATERAISHRVAFRTSSLFDASHGTRRSITRCSRLRSVARREPLWPSGGIVHKLGEQHRTTCRQRPARPPQVQSGRMAVPDRLLLHRGGVDRIQWNETSISFLRGDVVMRRRPVPQRVRLRAGRQMGCATFRVPSGAC